MKKRIKFFATTSGDATLVATGRAIKETTKELAANQKAKVKVRLKRAVRNRLQQKLDEKGKAEVKVLATATDRSGAAATDKVNVKMKD